MQVPKHLNQLKLCARNKTPFALKTLHAHLFKISVDRSEPFPNTLLGAYAKCGLLKEARQVFDEMPQRDQVSWASILTAHNQANLPGKTLSMFPAMWALDELQPDHFVFSSLVKACSSMPNSRLGKQVHAQFLVSSFFYDDVVMSSLVDMYSKCGFPKQAYSVFVSTKSKNPASWTAMIFGFAKSGEKSKALELFREAPIRNLFSYTALISGFVQSGNGVEALELFVEMLRKGVELSDPLVISSAVGACADVASLVLGSQVHGLVVARGFEPCVFVSNALVDMYAKCSDASSAYAVFGRIRDKDVVSWTSMIVGLARHGRAEEALGLYDEMVSSGTRPNEVTFVGLLYSCSHVGSVERGRVVFRSMVEDYKITPSLSHYTSFVDLLGRSGHLEEAERVLSSVPFDPDEAIWASLLNSCKNRGDTRMGIKIADRFLSSSKKIEDPSTYILLSNVYASAGKWDNVARMRKLMGDMEAKKTPGYSSVEFGRETSVFYAGESFDHPMRDEIFELLLEFGAEMKKRGYEPDTSSVLHDMESQEKERQLFWHSERLAVAYGLLKSVPGSVIRVVKNLRVCGDCHVVLKLISEISGREIFVRDANRYHHFKDGKCSCNEFW